MNKGQVIADLFFPTHKEASCAVRPGVTSFDYPAAGTLPGATLWLDFALTRDVRNITEASGESFCGPTAVAFVQTEMLPTPSGRLGTRQGNRLQRGTQQLDVVSVGTGDRDAQRHAATIRHDRSLDAELTAISRVFAGFFPRPTAPWSWLRPVLASAIRSRVACHTFADIFSRSDEISGVGSIPESTDAPCWASRTVAAMPSTGSPYATDRRFRRHIFSGICANRPHQLHCLPTSMRRTKDIHILFYAGSGHLFSSGIGPKYPFAPIKNWTYPLFSAYERAGSIVAPWVVHILGDVAMMGIALTMLWR